MTWRQVIAVAMILAFAYGAYTYGQQSVSYASFSALVKRVDDHDNILSDRSILFGRLPTQIDEVQKSIARLEHGMELLNTKVDRINNPKLR